jgi:hypothetical protein
MHVLFCLITWVLYLISMLLYELCLLYDYKLEAFKTSVTDWCEKMQVFWDITLFFWGGWALSNICKECATTQHHIPEESILQHHVCENLRSRHSRHWSSVVRSSARKAILASCLCIHKGRKCISRSIAFLLLFFFPPVSFFNFIFFSHTCEMKYFLNYSCGACTY